MTSKHLRTMAAVAATSWALVAAAQEATPQQPRTTNPNTPMSRTFQTADMNSDGMVSREEARRIPGVMEQFDTCDKNKDGMLDTAEFATVKMRR